MPTWLAAEAHAVSDRTRAEQFAGRGCAMAGVQRVVAEAEYQFLMCGDECEAAHEDETEYLSGLQRSCAILTDPMRS